MIQTFGVNDHATADMLSRRSLGSVSTHVTARRLVTPDEIMRMSTDSLQLLREGERPLWAVKVRYYDQREFAGLFDPALSPTPASED